MYHIKSSMMKCELGGRVHKEDINDVSITIDEYEELL